MTGFNIDFSRAHYPKFIKPKTTYIIPNIFNEQFMIGILLLVCGIISSSESFSGRRITLMMIVLSFLILLNMIWAAGTSIEDSDTKDIETMHPFDSTMFLLNTYFTGCVYYLLMIGAPVDTCRSFMLKENKRLYAMALCSLASFKMYF